MLNVGPCLWPSHGCAWCWRTSPHHPTPSTPSSSSSCIANLNGLLSNPLNLTFDIKYVPLSLSTSSEVSSITCTMISHPSCFISYSPILTPLVTLIHHSVTLRSLSPFPFDPLTSICSVLPIVPTRTYIPSSARWMPGKVSRSLISPPPFSYLLPLSLSSTHPPHANTSAEIQDGRTVNCSWRLWGAHETKGFLHSCIPLPAPFVHS